MRKHRFVGAILAAVLVAGVTAGLAPSASSQTPSPWLAVTVFDATATVGPDGLCLPGLAPDLFGSCSPGWASTQQFTFTVPQPFELPLSQQIPGACLTAGVVNGAPVTPQVPGDIPPVGDGNCTIDVGGDIWGSLSQDTPPPVELPTGGIVPDVGPSCGLSQGAGDGDFAIDNPDGPYPIEFGWVTSAGGTLPVTGELTAPNGNTVPFAVLVLARPLGGNVDPLVVPCVTEPAENFSVLGVAAIAGAS